MSFKLTKRQLEMKAEFLKRWREQHPPTPMQRFQEKILKNPVETTSSRDQSPPEED